VKVPRIVGGPETVAVVGSGAAVTVGPLEGCAALLLGLTLVSEGSGVGVLPQPPPPGSVAVHAA
jgi:hypothetical protein